MATDKSLNEMLSLLSQKIRMKKSVNFKGWTLILNRGIQEWTFLQLGAVHCAVNAVISADAAAYLLHPLKTPALNRNLDILLFFWMYIYNLSFDAETTISSGPMVKKLVFVESVNCNENQLTRDRLIGGKVTSKLFEQIYGIRNFMESKNFRSHIHVHAYVINYV